MAKTIVVVLATPRDGVQLRDGATPFQDAIDARPALRDRVELHFATSTGDLAIVRDAEVIVCGNLPAEVSAMAPRLRWVSFWASGLDRRVPPDIEARQVMVTNAAGVHGPNIAEHIMGYMLVFTRRLDTYAHAQRAHRWTHDEGPSAELTGQTLGIVGFGAIGRALAERARGFGMRIVATRRDVARGGEGVELYAPRDLPALVGAADHVAITVPYTTETHRLFDAALFARMKPGAYLYNISRGAVVDEAALIAALGAGRLAGAGLDVFETEPLPADNPLWDMPNVIVTPHVAGLTPYYFTRMAALFANNLQRYLDGCPLENLYDKARGY